MSYARGMGQTPQEFGPPALQPMSPWAKAGFVVVVGTIGWIFWKTISGGAARLDRSYALTRNGRRRRSLRRNRLSARRRRSMPLKAFAIPSRRAWPLDSQYRAYDAVRALRLGRVKSASDFMRVRSTIISRYPDVWGKYGRQLTWERVKAAKSKRWRTGRRRSRTHRRARSHRMAANRRRGRSYRRNPLKAKTELAINEAIGIVRSEAPREQLTFLSGTAKKALRNASSGLYRWAEGKLTRFKETTSLAGALTNMRIAASKSGEPHFLIDNGRYPVVVRISDGRGRTVYRVEEYARQFARVPAYAVLRKAKAVFGGAAADSRLPVSPSGTYRA